MRPDNSDIPLLSIVIATRNRIPYAISAMQSILENSDPRLELVIQDNSDNHDLETFIHSSIHDSRLRYRYTPPPFSAIDNFNAMVELSTGEYLCMIGDDDGVNPEIIDAAEWARREDLDSISIRNKASYLWPGTGVRTRFSGNLGGGYVSIAPFSATVKKVCVDKELRALVRNGGLYYWSYGLPKLYHGLVHRRCLQAVHDRTGAYFGGLSVDIYASLSVACIAKRVVITDYPLTLPGACSVSGSVVEGVLRKHSRKLEDAPHFRDRGKYQWSELVPRLYCGETIWADSALAALHDMGRDDLASQINVPRMVAHCAGANKDIVRPLLSELFRIRRNQGKNPVVTTMQLIGGLLSGPGVKFAMRVWNRVLCEVGIRSIHRIENLENMVEATHALSFFLQERGRRFSPGSGSQFGDECPELFEG